MSFGSLSTAYNALQAQRRGLDVAGQNVANANTPGYTRQRVDLQALSPSGGPAMYATSTHAAGSGVRVNGIDRLNDAFLDTRTRQEHATGAFLAERFSTVSTVENLLGEPSETGLSAQLQQFWAGWQGVADRPGDMATRGQVLATGAALVTTLQDSRRGMDREWTNARTTMEALAGQVSSTAAAVADLNASIQRLTGAGQPTNELADRRDTLLQELSALTGATVRPVDNGTVDVFLGGQPLVRGATANALTVAGSTTRAGQPVDQVRFTFADGSTADVAGGRLAALQEAVNITLPEAAARFADVEATLAAQVNELHATGQGLDGTSGRDFFTFTPEAGIAMAITQPEEVAAAAAGAGALDGSGADAIAAVGRSRTGPDAVWEQVVVDVAVDTQAAGRRADIQDVVTREVDNARQGGAGVDIDEEMTDLLRFQRAYEGTARVMTAIDQALDTLINRTGLVGR